MFNLSIVSYMGNKMFEHLIALFRNHGDSAYTTPLPQADARHAMGALMVRAAKADQTYLFEEINMIDKVLAERNGLNPVEAAKMRAACENLEKEMPATDAIASILKDVISAEEKEATLLALWRVVFADGVKHEQEDLVLHQIEAVLGVPADRAKQLQMQSMQ